MGFESLDKVRVERYRYGATPNPQAVRTWKTTSMNVEEEVGRLKEEITRLGKIQDDGSYKVTFGVLFHDDRCANIFEALVGTLRAAKKRKVVAYEGELLLQGVHDNVEIVLKPTPPPPTDALASK